MKRILALLFALCLLLCACGNQEPATTTTNGTSEETTAAPTEGTTEPTEPPIPRNPLNGEVLESAYLGRPTAVVISNESACLPQHGISQADFMFELETEGGTTRLLAVFSDVSPVEHLGPIRSARSFFNSISLSFDAPIIHCGGSFWGINGYMDDTTPITNWEHINQQYNGSYFFRDPNRSNYWDWLDLYTNGELLTNGLTDLELLPDGTTSLNYGFNFDENVALNGETANKVTMNFSGSKTTSFTYNEETGLYTASQYNQDHIDGNTGEALTYKNVFCLYTNQWGIFDGTYTRSFFTLVGEGAGHCAINGKIVPIKWSRATADDPFQFSLEDGTPLTLGVGHSYVGITSTSVSASYE